MQLMFVLGMGGHTEQMIRLVDALGKKYEYEYVIAEDDKISEKKIKFPGKIHKIKRTRGAHESLFSSIFRNIVRSFELIPLMARSKSAAIIACGPDIAATVCFVGKLFGKKVVFLESWSRVYSKSYSGRFVYLFADKFFVQWPQMKKFYKKAIYAGQFL